ncbi:transmembrane protein 19-like [Arapaima gigas]
MSDCFHAESDSGRASRLRRGGEPQIPPVLLPAEEKRCHSILSPLTSHHPPVPPPSAPLGVPGVRCLSALDSRENVLQDVSLHRATDSRLQRLSAEWEDAGSWFGVVFGSAKMQFENEISMREYVKIVSDMLTFSMTLAISLSLWIFSMAVSAYSVQATVFSPPQLEFIPLKENLCLRLVVDGCPSVETASRCRLARAESLVTS